MRLTLNSQPLAPVTVTLAPSAPTEGILSQTVLTFDASNWDIAQSVSVTGLDGKIHRRFNFFLGKLNVNLLSRPGHAGLGDNLQRIRLPRNPGAM